MSDELLPCPFCGGKPSSNDTNAWCWGPTHPVMPHGLINMNKEVWNRRPLPSSGDLEVREALEPFAKEADRYDDQNWHEKQLLAAHPYNMSSNLNIADLRRARSVLASLQEGGDRGGDGWPPVTPTTLAQYNGAGYACIAFFSTEADLAAFMAWLTNVDDKVPRRPQHDGE